MSSEYKKIKTSDFINDIVEKKFSMERKFKIPETFNPDFIKNFIHDKEDCINVELEDEEPIDDNNKAVFFESIINKQNIEPYYMFSEVSGREISNLVNAIIRENI